MHDEPLKYAHLEREVRYRLSHVPDLPAGHRVLHIHDRYLRGTRFRLRRVQEDGRDTALKLGQKVRLEPGTSERVAHTTLYLDGAEHDALAVLPADPLRKTRHLVPLPDGLVVAVDVFADHLAGLVTAEVDLGVAGVDRRHGGWGGVLDGGVDVTGDERFTGGALARATAPPALSEGPA